MAEDESNEIRNLDPKKEWEKAEKALKNLALMAENRDNTLWEKHWYESRDYLIKSGEMCELNCSLLVMLWIFKKEVEVCLCGRQLEKILTKNAAKEITDIKDLQCDQLMNIVTKCGIAEQRKDYDYNDPESTRNEMIEKVWKDIMAFQVPPVRLLILGRWHREDNGIGHCVVCDLDERMYRRSIKIYDPQGQSDRRLNQKEFVEYVGEDGGLYIYTVNNDALHKVIEDHRDILH